MSSIGILVVIAATMFTVLGLITLLAHIYSLNSIKSKTVGDGQHGTARWANRGEIKNTYKHINYVPALWRKGKECPDPSQQGIVVGCKNSKGSTVALVDSQDVHALMIGAAGVGKTTYFLYPNPTPFCLLYPLIVPKRYLKIFFHHHILQLVS